MTLIPRRLAFVAGAVALALAALSPAAAGPETGIDLAGMDAAVAPGDDFFAFANGTWLKTAEIPADRSTWGATGAMRELTDARTAELIKAAATDAPAGSEARKVGDYYAGYMDEAGIEAKGLAPVRPALARIARIGGRKALAAALGRQLRADVDVLNSTTLTTPNLLGLWVAQDLDDPSRYSPFLLQGGLILPDRDYYLDTTPRMVEVRTKYQGHIANVLKLAGYANAEARAAAIFELERKIALGHASRDETDDVKKGNNHWGRADFTAKAPGLDWNAYFAAAGLRAQQRFVVWQPVAVTAISALVRSQPLAVWKDYLIFHELEHAAPVLPKAFVDERFFFHTKVLSGAPAQQERWKRAVNAVNDAMGEAVGKLYAAKYFSAADKAEAQAMVKNLIAAFSRRIDALEWMSPETKVQAKAKLAALRVGVGYPDRWRDYAALAVIRGDALGNLDRAERFEYRYRLSRLGQPVDRDEWVMTPQTVNAVNLPAMNALNFPAAELQPPNFDRSVPANYGAMGAIIGHEISHSFDDTGALFDAQGRLRNWWTDADFAHFQASAGALVRQYDAYKPFPDLAIRGRQVLGENIADVAGLSAAYDAYKLSLNGQPAPVVGGYTGDQQFFIAYAQAWRWKAREAQYRRQVITDGHAPAPYRAATVRNIDAWYAAFDPKPGQALYLAPAERVRMW
jgi:putative endopeptidase